MIPTPIMKENIIEKSSPQLSETGKQIPIGNGGLGDCYYWTQSLNEITIHVEVSNTIRGKDITCVISPKTLLLRVADKIYIEGEFEDPIRMDESTWTLASGSHHASGGGDIIVTLEKTKKTWWKSAIKGHAEIDTSKVSY